MARAAVEPPAHCRGVGLHLGGHGGGGGEGQAAGEYFTRPSALHFSHGHEAARRRLDETDESDGGADAGRGLV